MISVCFRFDDPSPVSDHTLEINIIELFAQHDATLSVAVIPFRKTKQDELVRLSARHVPHLIEASRKGNIEVAQHGHSHIRRNGAGDASPSEFAGVNETVQVQLLSEGREHLAGVFGTPIKGFVPPWNTYDRYTTRIVEEAEFAYLSAGWDIHRQANTRLPIIPRTCSLKDARLAIQEALFFRAFSPLVIIVFHPDDFEEFIEPPAPGEPSPFTSLKELGSLLGWLRSIDKLKIVLLSDIAQFVSNGYRLWHPRELTWLEHLPYRIRKYFPKRIFLLRPTHWRTAG